MDSCKHNNIYFIYQLGENLRTWHLISTEDAPMKGKRLNQLEGILLTELPVAKDDASFSIAEKDRIINQYRGEFRIFKRPY